MKRKTFNIKECLLFILENIIVVLIIGALGAISLGYKNYREQQDAINSAGKNTTSVWTIINQNKSAATGLDTTVINTEKDLPSNAYKATVVLFIDYDIPELSEGIGAADKNNVTILQKYQSDMISLMFNNDVYEKVINNLELNSKYSDMKRLSPMDMSYMGIRRFQGAHSCYVSVIDVDKGRAEAIINEIVKIISSKSYDRYITGIHVVDDVSIMAGSSRAPKTTIDKKELLKKGIIGGIVGVMAAAVLLGIIFILINKVRTDTDTEYADLGIIFRIPKKTLYRDEAYKKLAYGYLRNKTGVVSFIPSDRKAHADYMESIKTALSDTGKNVSLFEVKADTGAKDIIKKIGELKAKSDLVIVNTEAATIYANPVIAALESDDVILTASYGKTGVNNLVKAKDALGEAKEKISGVVIEETKHING